MPDRRPCGCGPHAELKAQLIPRPADSQIARSVAVLDQQRAIVLSGAATGRALKRARALFEALFTPEDPCIVVAQDWPGDNNGS
jgi:hypothetical protein